MGLTITVRRRGQEIATLAGAVIASAGVGLTFGVGAALIALGAALVAFGLFILDVTP